MGYCLMPFGYPGGDLVAAKPWEHAGQARAALHAIVADTELGPEALSSGRLMANVLEDFLPDAPRERATLLLAAQAGSARALREHVTQGVDPATAIKLAAASLEATSPLDPDACRWVVTEMAIAIGLGTPADLERHDPQIEAPLSANLREPATVHAADVLGQPTQPPDDGGAALGATDAGLMDAPLTTEVGPTETRRVGGYQAKPAAIPRARRATISPCEYPPIDKRFWHLFAYLLPIVTFGWGILLVPLLMFKRDRLIRMNVIQSVLVDLTSAPTITFAAVAANVTNAPVQVTILAILAGISAVVPISLLLYCIISVTRHRQPQIIVLTEFARRLAYGKS